MKTINNFIIEGIKTRGNGMMRYALKTLVMLLITVCFLVNGYGIELEPWASNTDPSDVAKSHVENTTSGNHVYNITHGGTIDGENTRFLYNQWPSQGYVAQAWESNRSVCMKNLGTTDVINPWLSNGRNNFRNLQEIVDTATSAGMTDREKCLAVYYQQIKHVRHMSGPSAQINRPVKAINIFGYNTCGDDSACMERLWKHMGFQTNPVHALSHTISMVEYDGGWHMLDSDMANFSLMRDNFTIAGEADLGRDHDLIKRSHQWGTLQSDNRDVDEKHAAKFVYEGVPTGDHNYSADTTTMDMTLRPNEAITWRWGHLTPVKYYGTAPYLPDEVCNGLWEYDPDFSNDSLWRAGAYSVSNIENNSGVLTASSGQTGTIVWKVSSPYIIVGGKYTATHSGVAFAISWDNSSYTTLSGTSMDSHFSPSGTARYSYYLRAQLSGSDQLSMLQIENDVQMAPLALPDMMVGNNSFIYTDESASRSVRITHEWEERSATNPPNQSSGAIYPVNGGESDGTDIVFQWQAATDPDGDNIDDYRFELSEYSDMRWPLSSNFDKLISRTADSGQARLTLPYPGLLTPDKVYYWRVRALDDNKVWGEWSNTWSFTARGAAYPINVTMDTTSTPGIGTLKWNPNPVGRTPAKYRVYGSDEKGFSVSDNSYPVCVGITTGFGPSAGWQKETFNSNFVCETTDTQADVIGKGITLPNANKAYYRVVAVDSNDKRSWSSDFVEAPRPFIYSEPVTTVVMGQSYQYQVETIDSIGDLRLNSSYSPGFFEIESAKFSLTQGQGWLSIDQNTGELSGTAGTSGMVTVSVTLEKQVEVLDMYWLAWGQGTLIRTDTVVIGPFTQEFYINTGDGDTTPPSNITTVNDGTGSDISTTYLNTTLSANWTASSDSESRIANYRYAIGTTAGATDILDWTTNSGTNVAKTGLSLNIGSVYYFTVVAVNGAGLESNPTSSNGQELLEDTSPPSDVSQVSDGRGSDIDSTFISSELSANWTASNDSESGIAGYKYAIGTTAGATDITGWSNIVSAESATRTGLLLSVGSTYYFSVVAVNGAGLESGVTSSDGMFLEEGSDVTPPDNISQVRDGTGNDIDTTTSTTQLSANWSPSNDSESGILYYKYAIGTVAGWTDVVGWTDNGLSTSVTETGLNLASGSRYYFTVVAVNGLGLESNPVSSNGVRVNDVGSVTPRLPGEKVQVKVYPSPFVISRASQMNFSVNETNGGELKIYTISGKFVKTLTIEPGVTQVGWNLENTFGNTIKSGIYLYAVTDSEGKVKTGKIAIAN
jgi:hypothetical protein